MAKSMIGGLVLRRRLSLPWAITALGLLSAMVGSSILWTMLTGEQVDHLRELASGSYYGFTLDLVDRD